MILALLPELSSSTKLVPTIEYLMFCLFTWAWPLAIPLLRLYCLIFIKICIKVYTRKRLIQA